MFPPGLTSTSTHQQSSTSCVAKQFFPEFSLHQNWPQEPGTHTRCGWTFLANRPQGLESENRWWDFFVWRIFWGEEKWTKHQVVDQENKLFFSLRKFKLRHLERWIRYMHIEMIFTDLPILEIPNTSILDCKKKSKASSSKLAVSWFNLQGYKTYLLSWPLPTELTLLSLFFIGFPSPKS